VFVDVPYITLVLASLAVTVKDCVPAPIALLVAAKVTLFDPEIVRYPEGIPLDADVVNLVVPAGTFEIRYENGSY
jgi:hypothetical protein